MVSPLSGRIFATTRRHFKVVNSTQKDGTSSVVFKYLHHRDEAAGGGRRPGIMDTFLGIDLKDLSIIGFGPVKNLIPILV